VIDDLSANTVSNIVRFIYTGTLSVPKLLDEMIELTHASHRYQLFWLKELCSKYLCDFVTIQTFETILPLIQKYDLSDELKNRCTNILKNNVEEYMRIREGEPPPSKKPRIQ